LVKTVVAILNSSKTLDEAFISKGWIHIKTVILRNALLSTFSKNIKQLTYAGCQSEISSQLLLIQYESEDLLPICYQISYGVPEKCVEGDFTWRVSDCEELVGGYSIECNLCWYGLQYKIAVKCTFEDFKVVISYSPYII